MQRALTLVLVLSVAAMAADFFAFTADVLISGDPEIMGAIRGKLSYQYDPEGKLSYRKLELTLPNKYNTSTADYTEIINYTEGTKFLKCPRKCTATMWKHGVDKLFPTGNEGRDGSFKRFAESQEDIAEITFDANSLVSKVVYLSGKTITFTNVVKHDGPFDPATFDYSTWRCPKRTCKVIMDLVLGTEKCQTQINATATVLDDSGSISYDNWAALMRFTKAISTSFEVSHDATHVGLVLFNDQATGRVNLTDDPDYLNDQIDTLYHAGGATCVGCGIDTAAEILFNRSEARKAINPKTVVITVTDGGNNWPRNYGEKFDGALANLKRASPNGLSAVVSIHSDFDHQSEEIEAVRVLNLLPTSQDYVFPVANYEALMTVLDKLITATCQDYPPSPCGPSCAGFCACEECRCPNVCPTESKCLQASCSTKNGVIGCHSKPVDINDDDACTDDTCDPHTGISHVSRKCPVPDLCTTPMCDRSKGCYTKPIDCTANTTCSNYHCDPKKGQCVADENSCCGNDVEHCTSKSKCQVATCTVDSDHHPQCGETRPKCEKTVCSTVECDEGTGNCSFTPRSCDDGDFCTIDTCDASSGSTWETACKHTANPCDDSDPCTVDSCSNNQCVHKPLCDDGLRCTNDFCKATADLKNATCKHVLIDCDDYNYTVPRGDNYTCYRYFCSEEGGDLCLLKRYFTKSDDPCAECRNSTRKVKCIGGLPVAAAGAIIGAAAIAGIVVACVVGFLIFSAVSAFGTYKLVQMNRAGGGMAAHNNPMYKPNDAESVNPAYSSS